MPLSVPTFATAEKEIFQLSTFILPLPTTFMHPYCDLNLVETQDFFHIIFDIFAALAI